MMHLEGREILLKQDEQRDEAFCGRSLAEKRPSRYASEGAHDPIPSFYFVLENLFSKLDFNEGSHLLDVGCGIGRALAYFASSSLPGRATGVELDPQLAEACAEWSREVPNINVMNADATTIPLSNYTHFYLFNPFDSPVLERFIEALEQQATEKIALCHMSDNGEGHVFSMRPGWAIVEEGEFLEYEGVRAYEHPQHYTIRSFDPRQAKGPAPFKGYLETERLFLRPWLQSDAADLFEFAQDPRIAPVAGWAPLQSINEGRELISTAFSAPEVYAICLRTDGRAIGGISLTFGSESPLQLACDEAELNYWLGFPFWGRGIVPEAANALMERAFSNLDIKRIWGTYLQGNDQSKRVMEKCGLEQVRTNHNVAFNLIGARGTVHVMATPKR